TGQRAVDQGMLAAERDLGLVAHAEGRDADAVALFARGIRSSLAGFPDDAATLLAEGFFGDETRRARAVAMVDTYLAARTNSISHAAPWALLLLREPDRVLAVGQDPRTLPDTLFMSWLWSTYGVSARRSPHFAEFVRKMGLSELWDQRGPPDGCRRLKPGD